MINLDHIKKSIDNALAGKSNLTEEILKIRGFSTETIRHLFNNLCNITGTYLEIGLFCGASFCSSFNKNCTSIGIEDHSQDFSAGFETVKKELKENVDMFSDRSKEVQVHYVDCFNIPDEAILDGSIDIYSYDGFHSFESQAKALPSFLNKMKDKFVFLCDDFSWDYVKAGTLKGFDDLSDKIEIEKQWILGEGFQNHSVWHNGLMVCLINKV